MDTIKLGKLAENLATGLSVQSYRFVVLFLIVLGTVLTYFVSKSLMVVVLFFVLAMMLLLFSMLGEHKKPRGWKAVWTFYLMLSYVVLAFLLVILAFKLSFGDSDLSENYESRWHKFFEDRMLNITTLAEKEANAVGKDASAQDIQEFFNVISNTAHSTPTLKSDLVSVVNELDKFGDCKLTRCRSASVQKSFRNRSFDVWSIYRCYLVYLRNNGYGPSFSRNVQKEYEDHPTVRTTSAVIQSNLSECDLVVIES